MNQSDLQVVIGRSHKRFVEMTITAVVVLTFLVIYYISHLPPSIPILKECEIKPFVGIQQPDSISCGPTSVTMVLRYYGVDTDLASVKKGTWTKWLTVNGKEVGMTAPDLVLRAMEQFKVPSHLSSNTAPQFIMKWISEGRPVIVLLRSGGLLWHYVVVVGYTTDKIILFNPGSGEREEMPTKIFLSAWSFKTDMDGKEVKPTCPICKGVGHFGKWNLGPINRCDVCVGEGVIRDIGPVALRWLEVSPYTAIVPDKPRAILTDERK